VVPRKQHQRWTEQCVGKEPVDSKKGTPGIVKFGGHSYSPQATSKLNWATYSEVTCQQQQKKTRNCEVGGQCGDLKRNIQDDPRNVQWWYLPTIRTTESEMQAVHSYLLLHWETITHNGISEIIPWNVVVEWSVIVLHIVTCQWLDVGFGLVTGFIGCL
jgi:hypothetical protein